MRCTRCDSSFCWGCGKKEHKNGGSTCKATGNVSPRQAKAKAKAEIDRLMAVRASIAENSSSETTFVKKTEVKSEDGDGEGEKKDNEGGNEGGGGTIEMVALDAIPRFIDGLVEGATLGVRQALRKGTGVTWIEVRILFNHHFQRTQCLQIVL